MKRLTIPLALALTLVGGPLLHAQAPAASVSPPDRARLEQVLAAWSSLDVSRPAAFYAKDAGLAFYDVAPRKYNGWAEYEKGASDLLKTVESLTFRLNDDARVHESGGLAWATATVDGEIVNKDGSRLKLDARWTSVWEKPGGTWVIVHDHFSQPLPEPPPPKPAPTSAPKKP